MRLILRRVIIGIVLVSVLTVGVVGSGLVSINLLFLKDTIREEVFKQTGLSLHVDGDLRLRLGLQPTLSAQNIRLFQDQELLLTAISSQIEPGLWNTLKGEVDIRRLRIDGFSTPFCAPVDCVIPSPAGGWHVDVSAPLSGSAQFALEGRLSNGPVLLKGETGSLSALLGGSEQVPLSIEFLIADAAANVNGHVKLSTAATPGIVAEGSVDITNPAALLSALGAGPIPGEAGIQPILARFVLDGGTGGLRVSELQGQYGEVDFALAGSADWIEERPRIELRGELGQLVAGDFLSPQAR